ncbi:MAG: TFIIB-type zinc ribbon-containing protein [Planctomycetota bacterium]|jgi:Zn-finger nucleic acid-binding protein
MECPACGRQLKEMEAGDIIVDVCANGCGGVWFDNYELQKVDEKHESAGEALLDIPRDPNVKVDHTQKRPCPKCTDQPMMQHFMSIKREVEVDECPACGGLWLDCGELAKFRDQYENEGERQEAAGAYFDEVFSEDFAAIAKEDEQKLAGARKFAHALRFICPTYYIPGKQTWGAF